MLKFINKWFGKNKDHEIEVKIQETWDVTTNETLTKKDYKCPCGGDLIKDNQNHALFCNKCNTVMVEETYDSR